MTEAPIVGTGMEYKTAKDSGICVVAKHDGVVEKVSANEIDVKTKTGRDVINLLNIREATSQHALTRDLL